MILAKIKIMVNESLVFKQYKETHPMKQVASLRYDVIFKKAFSVPAIFTAFVQDFLDIELEINVVEMDKTYDPPLGRVAAKFDLYAEDKKNRIIVDIQHVRFLDHYHRFLHYHCAALLEQVVKSSDYRPRLKVFTLVVLTSGDKHKIDLAIIDFDPKDLQGNPLGEIEHKILYICPKYLNKNLTPRQCHEWMEAIEDSLDEQIDESHYTRPEIQRIFSLIEPDQITPQERAKMFDEYGYEAIKAEMKQKEFQQGKEEGLKEGLEEGLKQGEQKAKTELARQLLLLGNLTEVQIVQVTGLTLEQVKALAVG
jgi:predicted transposase/invertase (TIGR01784 family)